MSPGGGGAHWADAGVASGNGTSRHTTPVITFIRSAGFIQDLQYGLMSALRVDVTGLPWAEIDFVALNERATPSLTSFILSDTLTAVMLATRVPSAALRSRVWSLRPSFQ
jgi:hypothetical protein